MIKTVSLTPAVFHLPERVNEVSRTYPDNPIPPRSPVFSEILGRVREKLLRALGAEESYRPVFFQSSGSGAVASAIGCCVDKNGILVISNGSYGERMASFSRMYGHQTFHYELSHGKKPDLKQIESLILAHKPSALGIVHGATDSCHLNDLDEIAELVQRCGLKWVVDCVSTVFVEEIPLERWGIDVLIGSSNKGLHSTPGLGFLLVKNEFMGQVRKFLPRTPYFNLVENERRQSDLGFPFTVDPRLFLEMEAALDVFFERGGLEKRMEVFRERNEYLRGEFENLGLELFREPGGRLLNAGTCVKTPGGVAPEALVNLLATKSRRNETYQIYPSQNTLSDHTFRVFNFGEYDMRSYRNFVEVFAETLGELRGT